MVARPTILPDRDLARSSAPQPGPACVGRGVGGGDAQAEIGRLRRALEDAQDLACRGEWRAVLAVLQAANSTGPVTGAELRTRREDDAR